MCVLNGGGDLANIFDYLDWRGDLPLSAAPWSPVDSLIMANFCYNVLPHEMLEGRSMLLQEVLPFLPAEVTPNTEQYRRWRELLITMAATERFGSIRLHDYVDIVDPRREMQFSALTADLPDGVTLVMFRGTDNTIVGWREDFAMSYESPVPAQQEALTYLERLGLADKRPLIICGHSKGGNLAAYAAAHVSWQTQARIRAVYSFDGPGLDDQTMASQAYERIRPVLWSVIPQSSIIGMLMAHHQDYMVVRSDALGFSQHDAFTWQLKGPRFDELPDVDRGSELMDETVHEWLKACTPQQRHDFVDAVFSVLEATKVSTFAQLGDDKLATAGAIINASRNMDPDTRKMCLRLLGKFISIGATNAWEMLTEKPRAFIQENITKEANT